ncbi:hypothetical protein MRX96_037720 [Rhipicephalus microplus]
MEPGNCGSGDDRNLRRGGADSAERLFAAAIPCARQFGTGVDASARSSRPPQWDAVLPLPRNERDRSAVGRSMNHRRRRFVLDKEGAAQQRSLRPPPPFPPPNIIALEWSSALWPTVLCEMGLFLPSVCSRRDGLR